MLRVGLYALGCALGIVAAPSYGFNLDGYQALKLHRGLNEVDLGVPGQHGTVVVGHRANWNAHSVDVTTIYLSSPGNVAGLDIVGNWDNRKESLELTTSGGADCLLHDFRLLRSSRGPALVVADRALGETYADPSTVTFRFYLLRHNAAGLMGEPDYWFERVETVIAKSRYCDVGEAYMRELGLPADGVWAGP